MSQKQDGNGGRQPPAASQKKPVRVWGVMTLRNRFCMGCGTPGEPGVEAIPGQPITTQYKAEQNARIMNEIEGWEDAEKARLVFEKCADGYAVIV